MSIISTGFLKQAAVVAKGLGLPDLAIAEFPGVPMTYSKEELKRQVEAVLLPRVIEGLSKPLRVRETLPDAEAPSTREIVFSGSLDEVNEHFYRNFWSDGLPIIPPTLRRVERFMRFTDRGPEEVIGICPPANREATVWNVAVNGVMAGCRPEYMPILLAAVEAVCDPSYKVEDAGSTPGWESLIVLNGPIIGTLEFNHGQGVMRVGKQANTSIGRFLRLFLRNIAGFHHAPEGADKGSIGQSFLVVLPENEDAVAEIGWQPYSVDRGFKAGENVVTVQSVVAISAPTYTGTENAAEHMNIIADVIGERACGYWAAIGMVYSNWHPLIVLGPSIARVFAQDGWTKDDIRRHLYENVRMPASRAERYAYHCGQTGFRVTDYVKQGLLPAVYHESDDPNRLIPVFQRPEWTGIVVAGDWGRNQSKGYVCNHVQGPPTSKRIVLPKNWESLLAESRGL
ncbi:MAG TPA: hypothetical protein VKF40_00515 [Burkholderiales bacterium]|nr:hypothetical protein [Burkholderiales bacterium]